MLNTKIGLLFAMMYIFKKKVVQFYYDVKLMLGVKLIVIEDAPHLNVPIFSLFPP